MLPGMEDEDRGLNAQSARPPQRTSGGPRLRMRFSTPRVVAAGIVLVLLLLALVAFFNRLERFLIRDPRFALGGSEDSGAAAVEITGANHASPGAIEAVFAEDRARSVYVIPLSARRTTLQTVDWVKDASVARLWPNRLVVQVSEREPVAFVPLRRARYGLIDADGVILPLAAGDFALPVLTGVRASDPLAERRDRVRRMLRLTAALGDTARDISEIDVSDRDNLKISQPYEGRVLTLLLGDRDFARRYRNFLDHYEEIRRRLPGATTLDLRLEDRITVVE
jgi:cell division protein FtsQ